MNNNRGFEGDSMLEEKERYSFEDMVHFGQSEKKEEESCAVEDDREEEQLIIHDDMLCNIKANFFDGYLGAALFRSIFVFALGIYFSKEFSRDEKVGLVVLSFIEKLFFSIVVSSKMTDAFEHINTFTVYDQHYNEDVIDGKNEFSSIKNAITHNAYWTGAGVIVSLLVNYAISFENELEREISFSASFVAKIFPYLCSIDICQFLIAHKKYSYAFLPMLFYTSFEGILSVLPYIYDESKSYDINLIGKPVISYLSLIAFYYVLKSSANPNQKFCFLNIHLDRDLEKYYDFYKENALTILDLLKDIFTFNFNKNSMLLRLMMAFADTLNFLPILIMIYTISHSLDKETFESELLSMNIPIYAMKAASSYLSAVSLLGTILFRQYALASEHGDSQRRNIWNDTIKYVVSNAIPIALTTVLIILYSLLLNNKNNDISNIISNAGLSLFFYSANHITVSVHRGFYSFLLPIFTGTLAAITHVGISSTMQLDSYKAIALYFEYSCFIYLGALAINSMSIYYAISNEITRLDAFFSNREIQQDEEVNSDCISNCFVSFFSKNETQELHENYTFDQRENPESNYSEMSGNNMEYV